MVWHRSNRRTGISWSRAGASGFTLIEAILVITIGIVIVTSGTILYRQYSESVGTSNALDKVMALQETVEYLAATDPSAEVAYPDQPTLERLWVVKRPNDAYSSPWGGLTAYGQASPPSALQGGTVTTGTVSDPASDAAGVLHYWVASTRGGLLTANDTTGGVASAVTRRDYIVAICPSSRGQVSGYWFIRGAGNGTETADLRGQVGTGAVTAPDDAY
ncbi:MAG: hypothetical protein VKP72_06560 [bacterium]|nr:hypothetical protein [bacterium]